jgi:hypothetical protein
MCYKGITILLCDLVFLISNCRRICYFSILDCALAHSELLWMSHKGWFTVLTCGLSSRTAWGGKSLAMCSGSTGSTPALRSPSKYSAYSHEVSGFQPFLSLGTDLRRYGLHLVKMQRLVITVGHNPSIMVDLLISRSTPFCRVQRFLYYSMDPCTIWQLRLM